MTFFPFPRGQTTGAIIVNVLAILSAVSLFLVACRILWLTVLRIFRRDIAEYKEYIFFHTQLGYYAACLLLGNTFNSIAGLIGLPALIRGGLTDDGLCTTQGFVMQFGNLATAYFTVAIGVHTFNSLVLRRRQSAIVYSITIAIGWIFSGTIAAIPFILPQPFGSIYGVWGLSCGIRDAYTKFQFLLHLLPIFLAAFLSATLYSIIYLVLRGTLAIKGGLKLHLNPDDRWNLRRIDGYNKFVAVIAKSMLWYPIAYIVLLVPYSVTRLLSISGFRVPFQAVVFAFCCWFMLGVVNVFLLWNTLRVLSPAFDGRSAKDPESARSTDHLKPNASISSPDMRVKLQYQSAFPRMSPETPSTGYSNIAAYPEQVVSTPSYYNFSATSPSIGGNRSPASMMYSQGFGAVSPELYSRVLSRMNSNESLLRFPASPDRSHVPLSHRELTTDTFRSPTTMMNPVIDSQQGSSSPSSPASPQRAAGTLHRVPSLRGSDVSASEMEIRSWLERQNPDGSMPRGLKSQPILNSSPSSSPPRAFLLSEESGIPTLGVSPPSSSFNYI